MKKKLILAAAVLGFLPTLAMGQNTVRPVKNIILMISDGTSLSSVSLARWMQFYRNPANQKLNLDPYLCGTVRTSSSNAPIGDSAPTTSCYMSGQPSISGFVSTYPYSCGEADLFPIDTARAYQPTLTLLEAARINRNAATGLVFTCEFPHATPADCSAHSYNRGKYEWIVPQMVSNGLDVVIGGGTSLLTEAQEEQLHNEGHSVYRDDLIGMRADTARRMWALFGNREMDYDLDRDTTRQPSIAEMTRTAISKLSRDPNGFFLMVEGSKVDWAAHNNDPAGVYTEFLAFDRAVGEALAFARANGETAVIITADHGNSGLSIGRADLKGYDRLSKDQLFAQLARYRLTAEGLADKLNANPRSEVQALFREYTGFELNDAELKALDNCKGYKQSPIPVKERKATGHTALYSNSLDGLIAQIYTQHSSIGFTTGGHTGEDVYLAAYHPTGTPPRGMITNVELNHYMAALFGMAPDSLSRMSNTYFAPHTAVFRDYECRIEPAAEGEAGPTLIVKAPGRRGKQLTIPAFTRTIMVGKEKKTLPTVTVYVDKKNTFYLPAALVEELK